TRSLTALVGEPAHADRVAFHLERRGDHGWSGRVLESIGKAREAARAYERAGEATRAARLLEAEGDVVAAARVLEAQARREPAGAELHVELGRLLLRYGKSEAAVRALQKVTEGAPERRAALTLLVH